MAQSAYTAKLLSFIPEGVKTVLDVGCGIGGNAVYLCDRGFIVEGLAPDALQQERFIKNTKGRVPFYLTRFEDFHSSNSYDLVLLSESSQYIAVDDLAQGAARLLDSGGYLLLADMMRFDAEYQKGIFSKAFPNNKMPSRRFRLKGESALYFGLGQNIFNTAGHFITWRSLIVMSPVNSRRRCHSLDST